MHLLGKSMPGLRHEGDGGTPVRRRNFLEKILLVADNSLRHTPIVHTSRSLSLSLRPSCYKGIQQK